MLRLAVQIVVTTTLTPILVPEEPLCRTIYFLACVTNAYLILRIKKEGALRLPSVGFDYRSQGRVSPGRSLGAGVLATLPSVPVLFGGKF